MAVCEAVEEVVEAPVETVSPPVARGRNTKERLIMAAIALSAQRGFSNVPLREVVERAECHNISAVHYHFKSRAGLLAAMLTAVDQAWAPLDLNAEGEVSVLTVLDAWAKSLEDLKQSSPWGDNVVKFLARLAMEDDPNAATAFTTFLSARLKSACEIVAAGEADASAAATRLHLANSCLLTLMMSARLNRNCLAALGAEDIDGDDADMPADSVQEGSMAGMGMDVEGAAQHWSALPDGEVRRDTPVTLMPLARVALG